MTDRYGAAARRDILSAPLFVRVCVVGGPPVTMAEAEASAVRWFERVFERAAVED
jgi:hypothetical protein